MPDAFKTEWPAAIEQAHKRLWESWIAAQKATVEATVAYHGLREGRGRGANNATSLQRAIDDVSLTGGTILIPEGRYDIAAPISLKVRTDEPPAKSIAIAGKGRAVLVTRADSVFTIVHSDGAQLGRITIRDLELQGNLA